MAYTKQTWACGDTITAEKLNHMEDGISQGGGISPLVVGISYDQTTNVTTMDKTMRQIIDAFPNVIVDNDDGYMRTLLSIRTESGNYRVNVMFAEAADMIEQFDATTLDDYPATSGEG